MICNRLKKRASLCQAFERECKVNSALLMVISKLFLDGQHMWKAFYPLKTTGGTRQFQTWRLWSVLSACSWYTHTHTHACMRVWTKTKLMVYLLGGFSIKIKVVPECVYAAACGLFRRWVLCAAFRLSEEIRALITLAVSSPCLVKPAEPGNDELFTSTVFQHQCCPFF